MRRHGDHAPCAAERTSASERSVEIRLLQDISNLNSVATCRRRIDAGLHLQTLCSMLIRRMVIVRNAESATLTRERASMLLGQLLR